MVDDHIQQWMTLQGCYVAIRPSLIHSSLSYSNLFHYSPAIWDIRWFWWHFHWLYCYNFQKTMVLLLQNADYNTIQVPNCLCHSRVESYTDFQRYFGYLLYILDYYHYCPWLYHDMLCVLGCNLHSKFLHVYPIWPTFGAKLKDWQFLWLLLSALLH